MVRLTKITDKNFDQCIRLDVGAEQKSFVASNTFSLAQAWLYPSNARPYAIYNDDVMVGFVMLDIDYLCDGSNSICVLWRFMIDKNHQNNGFGRAAMDAVLQYVKANPRHDIFRTSFVAGNEIAEKLYKSVGFTETGELDGDEIVLTLDLRAQ